jgi:hypothetical protein
MSNNNRIGNSLYLKFALAAISIEDWLPKHFVQRFFDYGDTKLRELEKSGALTYAKIGDRKFYSRKSIIKLLEDNIQ